MVGNLKRHIFERWLIGAMFLLLPIFTFVRLPSKYVIVSLLFIWVFVVHFRKKNFRVVAFSKPMLVWLALTIYHWVNAMNKHVPEVNIYDLFHGFKIYACIVFFVYIAIKDFNKAVISLLVIFSIYLLMSFLLNTKSAGAGRLSGAIYATALGQTSALTGVYAAYYCITNNISLKKSTLYYLLPLIVVLSTQSRNSLAMLFIIIIGHLLAHNSKKGLKVGKLLFVISIVAIISMQLVSVVMEHTEIGQRFSELSELDESQEVNGIATGTFFDTIVGDRLRYYVLGWYFFEDSPMTGIGMWNFKHQAGGLYPLHTEYMVHLCEGGIIATVLWVWFIYMIFKEVNKSSQPFYIKLLAMFSIIQILFCGIYARVFYYEFFYPVIGLALSFSPTINKRFNKNLK